MFHILWFYISWFSLSSEQIGTFLFSHYCTTSYLNTLHVFLPETHYPHWYLQIWSINIIMCTRFSCVFLSFLCCGLLVYQSFSCKTFLGVYLIFLFEQEDVWHFSVRHSELDHVCLRTVGRETPDVNHTGRPIGRVLFQLHL